MTIPRIEIKEDDPVCTVLHCTGCDQNFYYADYLTQDPQEFLAQCVQDATEHECFSAGRVGYVVNPSAEVLERTHERDSEGRCLTCLRYGEKQGLIRRAVATKDKTERTVLLERARTL